MLRFYALIGLMEFSSKKKVLLFFVLIATFAMSSVYYLGHKESNLKRSHSQKLESLNAIFKHLGYGGAIHSFKNYVLRGEVKYYTKADESFDKVRVVILNYLDSFETELSERNSLKAVLDVVTLYEKKLEVAHEKIQNESQLGPDLDKLVRVSDDDALENIENLINLFQKEQLEIREHILFQRAVIYSLLVFLFLKF